MSEIPAHCERPLDLSSNSPQDVSYTSLIPPELVDLFIDALSHDRPSLKACALTGHAWLYRSQYRLHRHLRFSNLKHLTSDPLRYIDPAIAQYVHSLDLATLPTVSSSPADPCADRIQIWVILSRLTQVRSVTIRSLEDAATVTPFVSLAFPHVTELTLGRAEFDSFAQFKAFFASFVHLTRFQLDQFDVFPWASDSEDSEEESISEDEDDYLDFPLLRHMTLSGRSLYSDELIDLAHWLRSELPGSYSLQSLTFETWYGGRFGTMKAYLAACRRSLQVLELPMGASEPSIARLNFKRFGFRHLTKLQTLSFVAAEHPWAIRHYTSDCVALTLAEVTSNHISQVVFDFSLARGVSLASLVDFRTVDQVLSKPQFESVKFVDILCNRDHGTSRGHLEDDIRQILACTVGRDIVRLDFG
ncbi:hypothetical protein EUX98_g4742 [Antrodiella citrinella]|uniref:F-box domain-containing protein n=1 Tax=Antrodiella citrinella TaxID=2447956 RepID=A0A4S4MVQ1_9APHY|nr:hypothetical protein EUX98_g4742 [Antrodiella citrinella]